MTNKINGTFQTVSTKVDAATWALFQQFCERRGISAYQLLQLAVDTFVRYMDDHHQLTPAMETIIHTFEHLNGWNDAFNIADPEAKPQVGEAIYFMQDEGRNTGSRAVLVRRPWMGSADYTYNIQTMCERFFELVFPDMYRRLRATAVDLDTNSVIETIEQLLQEHVLDEDDRMLARIFSDCRRGDFGQHDLDIETGRPKAHPVRDMDDMFGSYDITNSDGD